MRATTTKATLASRASCELWLNAEATAFGPGRGDHHPAAELGARYEPVMSGYAPV
jgi:hypothetical protein